MSPQNHMVAEQNNQHGSGASVAVPQPAIQPASSAQYVSRAMICARSSSAKVSTASAGSQHPCRTTESVETPRQL